MQFHIHFKPFLTVVFACYLICARMLQRIWRLSCYNRDYYQTFPTFTRIDYTTLWSISISSFWNFLRSSVTHHTGILIEKQLFYNLDHVWFHNLCTYPTSLLPLLSPSLQIIFVSWLPTTINREMVHDVHRSRSSMEELCTEPSWSAEKQNSTCFMLGTVSRTIPLWIHLFQHLFRKISKII